MLTSLCFLRSLAIIMYRISGVEWKYELIFAFFRLLNRGPAIVVATPGRLWDLVQEGQSHLAALHTIRYLAIDETDRMSEKGHFEELEKILENIRTDGDPKRQTFVMSATLSLVHKPPAHAKGKKSRMKTTKEKMIDLMEFVGVKKQRKIVDITRKVGTAESLTESVINCSLTEKDIYLYYFISTHKVPVLYRYNSFLSFIVKPCCWSERFCIINLLDRYGTDIGISLRIIQLT